MSTGAEGGEEQAEQPTAPPQYAAPVYYRPAGEGILSKKGVFAIIAFGLFLVWVGALVVISDPASLDVRAFAEMLRVTGALLAVVAAIAGALGSRRTTDWQNFGLLVLAGLGLIALSMF
jgi:hypothetical protein